MDTIITVNMDLATYQDITNLIQKRDDKRLKMKERYYQNKARSNDKPVTRIWNAHVYKPIIEIELVNRGDIFEPRDC